jgi:selenocysteine lyase/cysteine desulfurase
MRLPAAQAVTPARTPSETMSTDLLRGEALLKALRRDFIGLDTRYPTADGCTRRRIYLDSAATTLMLSLAHTTATEFLHHNANTHSRIHFSARVATEAYAFARARVLSFVDADPERYVCLFAGHGATAALNRAVCAPGAGRKGRSSCRRWSITRTTCRIAAPAQCSAHR